MSDSRARPWPERLADLRYDDHAFELIRFREDPTDDEVRAAVAAAMADDDTQRERRRSSLGDDAVESVRLFAVRRCLQARRRASIGLIDEAIDGFGLLPRVRDVPWESWVKATLFVARTLGRDLESIGQRFADVASPDAVARFNVALEAMDRVTSMAQCHVTEVTTSHGIGFIETLVFQDTSSSGRAFLAASAPRQAANAVTFDPRTNLAQLAASLADAFDATGRVLSGPLSQDQLAASYFDLVVPGSYVETTGCLGFGASAKDDSASFTTFVAELPDGANVAALASAPLDGQAAFADDQRLVLLVAQPNFDGADEVAEPSMGDFGDLVRAALRDTASTRWLPR